MKHRGSWEQRRRNPCRHGHRAPRRHRRGNRHESNQLQVQKYSLHLRNLPPKVSDKDIELWLCRAAQLCLKCSDGDHRLKNPIEKVTKMYSKTQNSSSFHLKLQDVCTKQAIIQHVKDQDLRARLKDFYGDQSLVIEIQDFEPRLFRELRRQMESLRGSSAPSHKPSGEEESTQTET